MNEIDLVLQKFPSINREDLLILASILLDYWDNKCPESLTSLRADVESEEFFNLLSKVENYEYINGNLRIMGLKVIGTDIKLDEYSEVIPDENTEFHNLGYPIYEEWWNY